MFVFMLVACGLGCFAELASQIKGLLHNQVCYRIRLEARRRLEAKRVLTAYSWDISQQYCSNRTPSGAAQGLSKETPLCSIAFDGP